MSSLGDDQPGAPPPNRRIALIAQSGLIFALGLGALAPPAHGSMLLIPLTPSAAHEIDDLAARSGAKVIGVGALPRSRFVDGDRAPLLTRLLPRGILVLAGAPPFCGTYEGTEKR